MNPMIIELHAYGDRELWYVADSQGKWMIPLYLEWRVYREKDLHYALLIPAVALYHSQFLMLASLFEQHDVQGKTESWVIPKAMVEAILRKAPGITVNAYYRWPDESMPAIPLPTRTRALLGNHSYQHEPNDSNQESFIKYVAAESGIQTSLVRVVLKAVAHAAPKWMLERRKAIELGFCKIFAAPFRANWKEIMAFKFRKWKLVQLLHLSPERRDEALENAGIPQALCSPQNIALSDKLGTRRIDYCIECLPSKSFNEEANRVELTRQARGQSTYVATYENTVQTLYHEILAALRLYLQKTSLPFAHVSASSRDGKLCFLPTYGESIKVRGVDVRHIPVHIVSPDKAFSVTGEQSDERVVQATPVEMPTVSRPVPTADDVRQPDIPGHVEQSGQEGDNRLPMPNAYQGEIAGQSMLPNSNTGTG